MRQSTLVTDGRPKSQVQRCKFRKPRDRNSRRFFFGRLVAGKKHHSAVLGDDGHAYIVNSDDVWVDGIQVSSRTRDDDTEETE